MRLRHHTSVSIAGGKICVWPQAERRSFPTIKLDMSQLVHASATFSAWPCSWKPAKSAQYVYCHGNRMHTDSSHIYRVRVYIYRESSHTL